MPRLIDADKLEREMYSKCMDTDEEIEKGRAKWDSGLWIRYKVFEDAIALAPTVDVEPVRYGRWQVNEVNGYKDMTCLSCGWLFEYYDGLEEEWNYCPHCGAKMAECEAVLRWPRGEDIVDEQPTVDAVPVVLCKDCKFGEYDEDFPNQYYCPNWGCAFRSDWYCADGGEREDA